MKKITDFDFIFIVFTFLLKSLSFISLIVLFYCLKLVSVTVCPLEGARRKHINFAPFIIKTAPFNLNYSSTK